MAISSDGTWLATGSWDGTARIWAADDTNGSGVTAIRLDGGISDCAWFPARTDLCIAGQEGLYKFEFRPPGA